MLERGDVFFLYRPRVETVEVGGRKDVQRFFMVLAADRDGRTLYRLFAIGRKQLPEIRPGESHPEERNWALCVRTTLDAEDLRRELLARTYPTTTRGQRLVGAAKPVGEGRYQLILHRGHSELAYVLELPKTPGPAQEEFEIQKAASYIVAVKNPQIQAPEFPSPQEGPAYPERLGQKFADRRWIEVDDPELLDYEGTQIVLLGARAGNVEKELGIDIDEEEETAQSAEVFRKLRLRRPEVRFAPLFRGEFPERELPAQGEEVQRLPRAPARRTVGRRADATSKR